MDLCLSHNSLPLYALSFLLLFFFLFFLSSEDFAHPCPRAAAVSGVRTWLRFGFNKAMSHAGLLPPHSGVFAPTCVRLDLL